MKDETPIDATPSERAAALRARLKNFNSARRTSKIGSTELLALVAAFALLALTAGAYFFYLAPARARYTALQNERAQLQRLLLEATKGRQQDDNTQATVSSILASLEKFEAEKLDFREQASAEVVEELNLKTKRHSLTRAQFSFTYQDERAAAGQSAGAASPSAKRQQVFPGIDVSLTVDGPYPNLRRFVRDIEASPRLIVINGVQLEGVNESGAQRGALVSLRLDLSAFFRRAGAAPQSPQGSAATTITNTTPASAGSGASQ